LVFEEFVFDNYTLQYLMGHRLMFTARVGANPGLRLIILKADASADKNQFIHKLHQPFFYREIDSHNWVLNTYEERYDSNGSLFFSAKEYACYAIAPTSIDGCKKAFGDENQLLINF